MKFYDAEFMARAKYRANIAMARRNIVNFVEHIGRDESGNRIKLSAIHIAMHAHAEYCRRNGLYALTLMPWGHAKTTNAVLRRCRIIGENQNVRSKIISAIEEDAEKRLAAVQTVLLSPEYRAIYPDVKPDPKKKWSGGSIYIERSAVAMIEPTLEARSILGESTGVRSDDTLFDDVVTMKNAIFEPSLRSKIIQTFEEVHMRRLDPQKGFAEYIATPWSDQDLTAHLLNDAKRGRGRWVALVIRVADTDDRYVVDIFNYPNGYVNATGLDEGMNLPLWWKYNKDVLKAERTGNEASDRAYARGRRLMAYTDKDLLFPSFSTCWLPFRVNDVVLPSWPRIFGVDLSGQGRAGTVIFCGAVSPSRHKYPLEIRQGKWRAPEILQNISEMYAYHRPEIVVIENNGLQQMLIDMAEDQPERYAFWEHLEPYTTGERSKADETIGLPGLEIEFKNGSWRISEELRGGIPSDNVTPAKPHDVNCDCGICTWDRQMKTYSVIGQKRGEGNDCVMAALFFRHGCRLIEGDTGENQGIGDLQIR